MHLDSTAIKGILEHNINHVDELQRAMFEIEEIVSDPDQFKSVTELFSMYITGKASEVAQCPMWLCICAFNQSAGTSWPELCDP